MKIDRLRERMTLAGFSQADLAKDAGCTQGTIQQILDGTTRRTRFLPDIARSLGTTVEYLIGTTDAPGTGKQHGCIDNDLSPPPEDVNTTGNTIRRHRQTARLSVNEVAQATGLESSSLFHWEKARRNIELEDAWTLAKAIRAPLSAVSPHLGAIVHEIAMAEKPATTNGGAANDVTTWLAVRDDLASRRPAWATTDLNEAASSIDAIRRRMD